MRILIAGASGFIGSWVTRKLIQSGHDIVCCVRNTSYAKKLFPEAEIIACDFVNDTDITLWKKRLKNIDVIINCVGIFYHPHKTVIWKIHYFTPRALYDAASEMDVKKIIHISALNVENYSAEYATSKKKTEEYLSKVNVPSVILKPSLVYGPGSYGGMSLFRGLAGFPVVIPIPGKGNQKVQPIHVQDLAEAVSYFVQSENKNTETFMAVPVKPITLTDMIMSLRNWLGFSTWKIMHVPLGLIKLLGVFGSLIPYSTINLSAINMLSKDNIIKKSEAERFHNALPFQPKEFGEGLYSYPSSVQDRWHARLFFIAPLLRFSLAFMWLISAVTSAFLYPVTSSYSLLSQVGVAAPLQPFFLFTACLINFAIGLSLLFNYKVKWNCLLQIVVIMTYTVIISWQLPDLWLEPFGPIAKNIPILVSIIILWILGDNK